MIQAKAILLNNIPWAFNRTAAAAQYYAQYFNQLIQQLNPGQQFLPVPAVATHPKIYTDVISFWSDQSLNLNVVRDTKFFEM